MGRADRGARTRPGAAFRPAFAPRGEPFGPWAGYATAVALLCGALGYYGVAAGATTSLVLLVWILLVARMGARPARGTPGGTRAEIFRWVPSIVAGLVGAALYLDPIFPLEEGGRTLLLALISAGLAWALAPGRPGPTSEES